jgi:PPOX class probable FMN-dependent enzyme
MAIATTAANRTFRQVVTSKEELRAIFGEPSRPAVIKEHASLDQYDREFIARSPFLLLGTAGPNGRCDVSPKGDAPGFAAVVDEKTLVIPDRRGNRRIDSLQNIVDNPHVGLLFLIPGMDETLRVNGSAIIVRDDDLLDRLSFEGKRPQVAIVVTVEECFLHCARSFLRAHLWDPAHYMPREAMPSLARMILDGARPADRSDADHERLIAESEEANRESYRCLY